MNNSIKEALCLGIVTLIIGKIMFKFVLNRTDEYQESRSKKNNIKIDISLFLIGITLHLLLVNCAFNSWYCNKCNVSGFKRIVSICEPVVN